MTLSHPELSLAAVCKNGLEAIEYLQSNQVDLLLLDIQMPGINGFEVLNSVDLPRSTVVIFVTAYDQFALKAFEYHAIDYLLKPFTDHRFNVAITNAKKLHGALSESDSRQNLQAVLQSFKAQGTDENGSLVSEPIPQQRLVIKSDGKIVFLDYEKINWIEGYDYYIKVHLQGKVFLVRERLKDISERLPSNFLRIHKSSIVNLLMISELEKLSHQEYSVKLKDGTDLKVSRSYREEFDNALQLDGVANGPKRLTGSSKT